MTLLKRLLVLGALVTITGCKNEFYEMGVERYNNGQYKNAFHSFGAVESTYSKYDSVKIYMKDISTRLDSIEFAKFKKGVFQKRFYSSINHYLSEIEERKKWESPYLDSVVEIRAKMEKAVPDTVVKHHLFLPAVTNPELKSFCQKEGLKRVEERDYSASHPFATFIRKDISIFDSSYTFDEQKVPSPNWLETYYQKYENGVKIKVRQIAKNDKIGKVTIEFFYNEKPALVPLEAAKFIPLLPGSLFENESIRQDLLKSVKAEKSKEYKSSATGINYNFWNSAFPGHITVEIGMDGYERYYKALNRKTFEDY